jgi:hypothetical protein
VYVGLFAIQYLWGLPWGIVGLERLQGRGLPLDREYLIGWLLLGSIAFSVGRGWRDAAYAVAGWGALAVCFVLYDFTRGAIDGWWGNHISVPGAGQVPAQAIQNADRLITAERALFFGVIPTEFLQDHIYQRGGDGPRWEIVTAMTYVSHFVVVYAVALFQWAKNRTQWLKWVRSLVTLIVLGVSGYLLYPMAPPWMAGRAGLMNEVERPGTRGLRHVSQFEVADRLWSKGRGTVNLVAAMPSLHFAFTTLVLFFFWRTAKPWLRVILIAYPVLMLFTLAYGGEHFVLDCVAGALLAWFAVWINRRYDAWRDGRAERAQGAEREEQEERVEPANEADFVQPSS